MPTLALRYLRPLLARLPPSMASMARSSRLSSSNLRSKSCSSMLTGRGAKLDNVEGYENLRVPGQLPFRGPLMFRLPFPYTLDMFSAPLPTTSLLHKNTREGLFE